MNPYSVKSDKKICKFISIVKNGDVYLFKIVNEQGQVLPAQPEIYFTQESLTESEEIMFIKELSTITFLSSVRVQFEDLFKSSLNTKINPEKRESFKKYVKDEFYRICIQLESYFNTRVSTRLEFKWKEDSTCDISIIPMDLITRGIIEEIYSLGKFL